MLALRDAGRPQVTLMKRSWPEPSISHAAGRVVQLSFSLATLDGWKDRLALAGTGTMQKNCSR